MANNTQLTTVQQLKGYLSADSIKQRFQDILGKKAAGFTASVLSVASNNTLLSKADPKSILNSAMVAATLDLPINGNLGFAYIVPYGNAAQFQLGWKGLVQLAQRSGQYEKIEVNEVYEGEIKSYNRFSGVYEFGDKTSDTIVGYLAYFKLLNGFEKYLYMSKEDCEKHGKRYSQTYKRGSGIWATDFDAMAKKTVLKQLLGKWGVLSIEMQRAQTFDQAVVKTDFTAEDAPVDIDEAEYEYVDNDQSSARQNAFADALNNTVKKEEEK